MQRTPRTPRRKTAALAGAAGILAILVALAVAALAPAERASVIGGVRGKAPPSCPTTKGKPYKTCLTVATVTGFQMVANGKKAPMKVKEDGKLVAWTLDLSKPSRDERMTLTDGVGLGDPTAKLSILKPVGKGKFKLTKQSPPIELNPVLGTEPIFTLKKPIRVSKGNVVAISTSSWAPNLAHNGALTSADDKWRGSRDTGKCGDDPNKTSKQNQKDLLEGKPQRKIGGTVRYGCTYTAARLLYDAYYVPVQGGGGGKGGNGGSGGT